MLEKCCNVRFIPLLSLLKIDNPSIGEMATFCSAERKACVLKLSNFGILEAPHEYGDSWQGEHKI